MSLVAVPSNVDTLLIPLPTLTKANLAAPEGRRLIYFETSREGVIDREGEDIATDALWASRRLFLEQGNIDINHWSWLGNPPGTGMRPEYVIGLPVDVKRRGPSIFVKAGLFSNAAPPPPGSSGEWADRVWHSLTQMRPPMRWFPSVFGKIGPGAVELQVRGRKTVRFIKGPIEWYSVGLAQRAQHPALPPVSLEPVGSFKEEAVSKAVLEGRPAVFGSVAVIPYPLFAKALTTAAMLTAGDAHALDAKTKLVGAPALRRESLEGQPRRTAPGLRAFNPRLERLYTRALPKVLAALMGGRVEGTLRAVAEAFRKAGVPEAYAALFAKRLGLEALGDYA